MNAINTQYYFSIYDFNSFTYTKIGNISYIQIKIQTGESIAAELRNQEYYFIIYTFIIILAIFNYYNILKVFITLMNMNIYFKL